MATTEGHHHLRRHGLDPHADACRRTCRSRRTRSREAAIGAAKAGAAIVHLHARDPKDGRPTQDPEMFREFLPQDQGGAATSCINLTTGGAPTMTIEERLQPALQLKPEVASLNMGSMNFGLYEMTRRATRSGSTTGRSPTSPAPTSASSRTRSRTSRYILQSCSDNDTRFEIECYDIGHLYTAAHFLDRGLVKPPLFIQSVFGIRGGIGPHPEDVMHMKRTADRLFGDAVPLVGARRAGATRCTSPRSPRSWAATCASASRTACGSAPASWRRPTPSRCARRADPRGARPGGRHARRRARDPRAERARPRGVLKASLSMLARGGGRGSARQKTLGSRPSGSDTQ